jgi:aspartyl-tRNA synthetase
MPGGASSPRRELDARQDWAKARGAKGLAYILVQDEWNSSGPGRVAKNLSEKRERWNCKFCWRKKWRCNLFRSRNEEPFSKFAWSSSFRNWCSL